MATEPKVGVPIGGTAAPQAGAKSYVFVGQAGDKGGRQEINYFNVMFKKGEATEVVDKNAQKKIENNPEFMTVEQFSKMSAEEKKSRGIEK